MKMKKVPPLALLLVFCVVTPAMANNPPGLHVLLSEVLILPVMIVLSLCGGAYAILASVEPKPRRIRRWLRPILVILAILFSGMHEALGALVALIFGYIALKRGARMIGWGLRSGTTRVKPERLAEADRWRLIPAGVLLVVVTLFLMGMAVAFVGYWPSSRIFERELRRFVTYQLAYGNLEESRSGNVRFRRLTPDSDEFWRVFFVLSSLRKSVRIEYGADDKTFTVHVLPAAFPFFPYNYLTSQPCYHADETGQIRMTYVHNRDERCAGDAPVVMRVGGQDLQKMLRDENSDVRDDAAFALGELNDPRMVEPLIAALQDKDPSVRDSVAQLLARLNDPRAVDPLIAALKDEKDEWPRRHMANALERITGQNIGQDPGGWEKWWREHKGTAPAGK